MNSLAAVLVIWTFGFLLLLVWKVLAAGRVIITTVAWDGKASDDGGCVVIRPSKTWWSAQCDGGVDGEARGGEEVRALDLRTLLHHTGLGLGEWLVSVLSRDRQLHVAQQGLALWARHGEHG